MSSHHPRRLLLDASTLLLSSGVPDLVFVPVTFWLDSIWTQGKTMIHRQLQSSVYRYKPLGCYILGWYWFMYRIFSYRSMGSLVNTFQLCKHIVRTEKWDRQRHREIENHHIPTSTIQTGKQTRHTASHNRQNDIQAPEQPSPTMSAVHPFLMYLENCLLYASSSFSSNCLMNSATCCPKMCPRWTSGLYFLVSASYPGKRFTLHQQPWPPSLTSPNQSPNLWGTSSPPSTAPFNTPNTRAPVVVLASPTSRKHLNGPGAPSISSTWYSSPVTSSTPW